uniref:Insulin receptor substrate 1 n=1 Tax=Cacopsylla melanoneura TaxID=428564 RepID=A0A8D8S2G5_9HEMI
MSKTGMSSVAGTNGPRPARKVPRNGEIVRKGYLKKMKTMRKKFFVLRAETSGKTQACLEYHDSEKKFERHPNQPKRSIVLSTCFNINRRTDTKHKHVIALYTGRDVFSVVFDSAPELEDWLQNLLLLQHGEDLLAGELLEPKFEFVWQVEMANRELGGNKNITGPYLLCLTEQSIKLVKTGTNIDTDKLDNIEFSIHSIRCCGDYQTFFYLEVGTATVTGPGNLWMQVDDNTVAANMHATVLKHCMTNSKKDPSKNKDTKDNSQYHSTTRVRSPSVSEISRPIGINHSGSIHSQPYRTRTNSEGMQPLNQLLRCSYLDPKQGIQPHQFYKDLNPHHSHHHLIGSPIVSPTSDSAGSSLSLDNVDGGANDNSVVRSHHSLSDDYSAGGGGGNNTDAYVVWNAEKRKEDERLNNYLTDNAYHHHNHRKISPSSPSQASYLDVQSSYGSSPMDHFPMSPVSVMSENKNRLVNGCLSVSHSRGSSITEDGYDTGGYMDMDPKKHNRRYHHDTLSSIMSPGGSSTSMSSVQFPEYPPLDRVSSYLSPAEEETTDNAPQDNRQKRAYSVGSRPENLKNKVNKNETQDCPRTRAFSVGSKVGVGSKPRGLPPPSSSQSSLEHSEDMMELDFSHSRHRSRGRHSNEKLSVPAPASSSLSSAASSYSTAEGSSYMESPRLGSQPDLAPSPPRASFLQRAFGRSPPKNSPPPSSSLHLQRHNLGRVLETPPGYVEMRPSCKGAEMLLTHASSPPNTSSSGILSPISPTGSTTSTLTNLTSCSPPNKSQPFRIKTGTPPKFIDEDEDPYMDMAPNPGTEPGPHVSYKASIHPRPERVTDYMEMNLKRKTSLEEDNNNKRHGSSSLRSRPSSLEESRMEDYMNMNVGKKERRKNQTQPITISCSSSPSVSSPLSSSRKLSAAIPSKAPMFLPLSNSSPARTTRRKSSLTRRDSRETPPTIFPFSLNSPAISPAESESPSGNSRLSEPLESVKEVVDSNDYVNFAPDATLPAQTCSKGDDYVEMQIQPSPAALSHIAPPALASVAQGKTLEQVQKKLVILGLNKTKKNPSPPPNKEITYESLDLESSSSSCSSLASRSCTSYATIDHSKTGPSLPPTTVPSPKKT